MALKMARKMARVCRPIAADLGTLVSGMETNGGICPRSASIAQFEFRLDRRVCGCQERGSPWATANIWERWC